MSGQGRRSGFRHRSLGRRRTMRVVVPATRHHAKGREGQDSHHHLRRRHTNGRVGEEPDGTRPPCLHRRKGSAEGRHTGLASTEVRRRKGPSPRQRAEHSIPQVGRRRPAGGGKRQEAHLCGKGTRVVAAGHLRHPVVAVASCDPPGLGTRTRRPPYLRPRRGLQSSSRLDGPSGTVDRGSPSLQTQSRTSRAVGCGRA